jgi:hypothetical protein
MVLGVVTMNEPPKFLQNEPPKFLQRRAPTAGDYAPPSHPDRRDGLAELSQALDDFRDNSTPREMRIARLLSEMPVHEALDMAQCVLATLSTADDAKPDIRLMLQMNKWARSVVQKESAVSNDTARVEGDKPTAHVGRNIFLQDAQPGQAGNEASDHAGGSMSIR